MSSQPVLTNQPPPFFTPLFLSFHHPKDKKIALTKVFKMIPQIQSEEIVVMETTS